MVSINQRTRTKVDFIRGVVHFKGEITSWWDFDSLEGESNKSAKNPIFVSRAGAVVIIWEVD